jgi:hypothetical protein
MAAIEQTRSGMTVGHVGLGARAGGIGTVGQVVHDGDTVSVLADGNFSIRFLGVDAPEVSLPLPGRDGFSQIDGDDWQAYLDDPFAAGLPPFDPPLGPGLEQHLRERAGPGTATNHAEHADAATNELRRLVRDDIAGTGSPKEDFRFFLAFAHEVTDRYGRLLCFAHRNEPDRRAPRPASYNDQLITTGQVSPYFIWPNINPFRRSSLREAVPTPGQAGQEADADAKMRAARLAVREARNNGIGVFEPGRELRLLPFELRLLSRRQPPDRWLIDLGSDDGRLLPPQEYYRVANWEDRLFVPDEYVPLFREAGWLT